MTLDNMRANGVRSLRDDRCRCAAELGRTEGASEPDRVAVALMARRPTPEMIAEGLTVPERIVLRRVGVELAEGRAGGPVF